MVRKKGPSSRPFLLRGPNSRPLAIKILGPYSFVAVHAIGPETDFTVETNRTKVKEKLVNTFYNHEFHFLYLEFQTIEIQ